MRRMGYQMNNYRNLKVSKYVRCLSCAIRVLLFHSVNCGAVNPGIDPLGAYLFLMIFDSGISRRDLYVVGGLVQFSETCYKEEEEEE